MDSDFALRDRYDVVIVGGGHNALTAAAYLARAGLTTLVLERLDHTGGAAISAPAFSGHDVRLSRYSYLVSLMPQRLIADLDLGIRLASRSTASFTPVLRDGRADGLFVQRPERGKTARSFRRVSGGDAEYSAWQEFYRGVEAVAGVVAPTLLKPLPTATALRERAELAAPGFWHDLVERPLGEAIERRFSDDTVRGVVATDALIGTFASMHDPSLLQNRCFLYHLIGNGTGEWQVPIGGMGAVTDALRHAASKAGAEIITGAGVSSITPGGELSEVAWHSSSGKHSVEGRFVLAGVAPWVLRILLGEPEEPASKPVGAQLKINMLLDRLPRLRADIDAEKAFAGTLHLNEDYSDLEAAYLQAAAGELPSRLPGEVYCHSLTDPSILGSDRGRHTLTYFGLHTPSTLFDADPAATKARAVERALASLNQHLVDPIEECLARDASGTPCLEAKIPQEIEADLAMPGGHIFHGELEWPWASPRALMDSPARRWGVSTGVDGVLLCGSGARRGGAVSGIGGHNAAQAVLESL